MLDWFSTLGNLVESSNQTQGRWPRCPKWNIRCLVGGERRGEERPRVLLFSKIIQRLRCSWLLFCYLPLHHGLFSLLPAVIVIDHMSFFPHAIFLYGMCIGIWFWACFIDRRSFVGVIPVWVPSPACFEEVYFHSGLFSLMISGRAQQILSAIECTTGE